MKVCIFSLVTLISLSIVFTSGCRHSKSDDGPRYPTKVTTEDKADKTWGTVEKFNLETQTPVVYLDHYPVPQVDKVPTQDPICYGSLPGNLNLGYISCKGDKRVELYTENVLQVCKKEDRKIPPTKGLDLTNCVDGKIFHYDFQPKLTFEMK